MDASLQPMMGPLLPQVPETLVKTLDLKDVFHRYRHWVAKSANAFYKLAPLGSAGENFIRLEGELLQRFDHPNIVKGSLQSQLDWEILRMDAIPGEPLTKIRSKLTTETKMQILGEIENAVKYINNHGILHADVCSENILWTGKQSYLIDFEEAILTTSPLTNIDSPDFIGGPPCCWGDNGYGYKTYLCFASLREWLLTPEFLELKQDLIKTGVWNPHSTGNTCDPWSTPDDGSVYQTVSFGNTTVKGQRDPHLRFKHLSTSKQISFESKRILDIGCNFGRLGAFLNSFGVTQYVGLDLSPDYIDVAKKIATLEGRSNSKFIVGDVCAQETLDRLATLSPAGYDIVICQSVYHHIKDKKLLWKHILKLQSQWVVFENPIDDAKYLLTDSWEDEKAYLRKIGYDITWESYDNDYSSRVLAVFEKIAHS
jgi:2-polyprenyl-3-methyl-5-hydroxy-6-metoxy-1,4-benzoquinol methylase